MFIVFDGIDYCGKSLQTGLCRKYIRSVCAHRKVRLTREPTKGNTGRIIRHILRQHISIHPIALQTLFVLDRKSHLRSVIIPELAKGSIVLSDRYDFVTYAYGLAAGFRIEDIYKIHAAILGNTYIRPDMTLFIRVSAETACMRLRREGVRPELFELKKTIRRNAAAFDKLAPRYPGVAVIDGEGSVGEVYQRIQGAISSCPKFRKMCEI